MGFLQDQCSFGFYNHEKADTSKPFRCGDDDLDEFFTDDAFLQSDELLCKNYCFTLDDDPSVIVAAFTLSNDSIKKIPGSRKKKVEKNIPREKQYSSYPAVMIGRLGISVDFQSRHLGSDVLSFIKAWFVDPLNKTGCRFLLVDSYNKERNLAFYERNGTVAEGWISDAIRFWQHQISGTSGVRSISSNTNQSKGIYALDGTRRDTLQRGINIVNGHKILMR